MKIFIGAFLAIATIITPSIIAAQTGLSGANRNDFVESTFKGCFQSQTSDPRNREVKTATLAQYCLCFSNEMADGLSPEEAQLIAKMQSATPSIQLLAREVSKRCASKN